MHISSLPGQGGIGTLGRSAYDFADLLHCASQSFWQLLPLGPTGFGDSPYQSFSTFAGNPYYIDFELLRADGLINRFEFPMCEDEAFVDYAQLYERRYPALRIAFSRFEPTDDYERFCNENADWLEDYALFMAIKQSLSGCSWDRWPEPLRRRIPDALAAFKKEHAAEAAFWRFLQYEFFKQWRALKRYVNSLGIKIIGDLPIYVSADSADIWASPELFDLDDELTPRFVAGCPPDAFSATGQLWGNPLYKWERHRTDSYGWWTRRLRAALEMYDVVRIDHFRGLESYCAIPFGDPTAERGEWKKGPGLELFDAVQSRLGHIKVIAEDLGMLTDSVREMRSASGFPGMRVMEFGFEGCSVENENYPDNIPTDCVAYCGTHDNMTAAQWYTSLDEETRLFVSKRTKTVLPANFPWDFIELLMSLDAETVIVQAQDLLSLGGDARMNEPSTTGKNWCWRVNENAFGEDVVLRLKALTEKYSRAPNVK